MFQKTFDVDKTSTNPKKKNRSVILFIFYNKTNVGRLYVCRKKSMKKELIYKRKQTLYTWITAIKILEML